MVKNFCQNFVNICPQKFFQGFLFWKICCNLLFITLLKIICIHCLINHSCYSNTNYVKFPDLHLELRSQIPIKKGEQIYTRYISATIGNYTYIPLIILSLVGNYNGVDVLFFTILHIKFYRKHETARRY